MSWQDFLLVAGGVIFAALAFRALWPRQRFAATSRDNWRQRSVDPVTMTVGLFADSQYSDSGESDSDGGDFGGSDGGGD